MPPSTTKKLLAEIHSLLDKKEYERAIEKSQILLKKDASNYHAHVFIGAAAIAQRDFELGLDSYQAAISLRPDLPLAYKGVIRSLSKSDSPAHPLRLARAYFGLGRCPGNAEEENLTKAANHFFHLALSTEAEVRNEAISTLQLIQEQCDSYSERYQAHPNLSFKQVLSYRICKLLSLSVPAAPVLNSDSELKSTIERTSNRFHMLQSSPMSKALDALEDILLKTNDQSLYDGTAELIIERAVGRCLLGIDVEQNINCIRSLQAYEALLHVAETDSATKFITKDERIQFSLRAAHTKPFDSVKTRSMSFIATLLFATNKDDLSELSIRLVSTAPPSPPIRKASTSFGISIASGEVRSKKPVYLSCSQAFVVAWIHYSREDFKKTIEACKAGIHLISTQGEEVANHMQRMRALFSLIMGRALCDDRRWKDSLKEFEEVHRYAMKTNDEWMTSVVIQNMVSTAIAGHGRKSKSASIVMEEAASDIISPDGNLFGLMESIWTDALTGDIEIERMDELTTSAIRLTENEKVESQCWEYALLDSAVKRSSEQIASAAATRLGQMILKSEGYKNEISLERVQKSLMQAANLAKGTNADAFALLGFIFEQRFTNTKDAKMNVRAMRCYERSLGIDEVHPVASRRMVRLLLDQGRIKKDDKLINWAIDIAETVSQRKPKARWAFNILGWQKLTSAYSGSSKEAVVLFQSALRGKPPRWSAKEQDSVFGTTVASTMEDNNLIIDIDSWRGLSIAYRLQGKLSAAHACLQDAVRVMENPPPEYAASLEEVDVQSLTERSCTIIEVERNVLNVTSRKVAEMKVEALVAALSKEEEIVRIQHEHGTLDENSHSETSMPGYYLSEMLVTMAADAWVNGSYTHATAMRLRAAKILKHWTEQLPCRQPQLDFFALHKRLGDTWMEVAGSGGPLDKLCWNNPHVGSTGARHALDQAAAAYARAGHLRPWDLRARATDLAAVLQGRSEKSTARLAVDVLQRGFAADARSVDASTLAVALLGLAATECSNKSMASHARAMAARCCTHNGSAQQLLPLNAALASSAALLHNENKDDDSELQVCADAAVRAARDDPTNWRAPLAIATVRRATAHRSGWDAAQVQSCDMAYAEADRLGAGPPAVAGRLVCLERLLANKRQDADADVDHRDLHTEACFVFETAKRIGETSSELCRDVMREGAQRLCDEYREQTERLATRFSDANTDVPRAEVYSHVHRLPFVQGSSRLMQSFTA